MNYSETLSYLFAQLPLFQRIGASAYKADLNNTIELCKILKNPQTKFKTIHVAGTNGKGSTSHMIASILQESGYKVGLYTSPHLVDFRERIKINGKMINKSDVVQFTKKHKVDFESIQLSFFEWTVGLAFDYFARSNIDIAVIETGLGGRLDSTNVIHPVLSIITNISKDHVQFLGDSLEKIAIEKAGIIKFKTPVIIGETQDEISQVFIDFAKKNNAQIYFADQIPCNSYNSDLKGVYQEKNKKTVVAAISQLRKNDFQVSEESVIKGLKNVIKNTGLKGRWQTILKTPLTICDTGHNESGIKEVLKHLSQMNFNKLHIVFGAVNDKDISTIIDLLPSTAEYYFCQAQIPRALDVKLLSQQLKKAGLKGKSYSSVEGAVVAAINSASVKDLVFIGGSTFVVAEALQISLKKKKGK